MRKSFVAAFCALLAASVFADSPVLPPMGLPKEYQQVESLISTGTQYIVNSGYKRNKNTSRIKVEFYTSNYAGKDVGPCGVLRAIFGETVTNGGPGFGIRYRSNNAIRCTTGTDSVVSSVKNGTTTMEFFFDYDDVSGVTVTGTYQVVTSKETTSQAFNDKLVTSGSTTKFPEIDMGIFCNRHSANGAEYPSAITLYSFQIWERDDNGDEVQVCDFVPCYRRTDGVAGLYDVLSTSGSPFRVNESTQSTNFEVGAAVFNVNKIAVNNTLPDVPEAAGLSPACGVFDVVPGEPFAASVANVSVFSSDQSLRYTLKGWELIVANVSGASVKSNGIDNVSACTFTPVDGDEVHLTWIWQKTKATTRIFVTHDSAYVPPAATASPVTGESALTPDAVCTASVTPASVLNPSGTFRHTVTGWERVVTNKLGEATVSSGTGATCDFTPVEGDDVYLMWKWESTSVSSSEFQVLDAEGITSRGTFADLASAVEAATNDCAIVLTKDSVWDSVITVQNKHVTLKSADGYRYSLTRVSGNARFVIDAEDDTLRSPQSLYSDYSDEGWGIEAHAGAHGHEAARLCITNLVIDGGLLDGVSGSGSLFMLNSGVKCSTSHWSGYYCANYSGLKLQDGAEIRNVATVDAYLINCGGQYTVARLYKGSKIHDVKGERGVLTITSGGSSTYSYNMRMLGAEIYNCRSEGSPIVNIGPRRLSWTKIRFSDCVITNNLVASDALGAVYCSSSDSGQTTDYYAFNVAGDVRITDNFLLDGVTPANVRINNNTSMDIHQKLGPKAKIGLAYTTGSAKVEAVEGATIGKITPTSDKGSAKAIYFDSNPRFHGKIDGQDVVWKESLGMLLIIR